MIVQEGGQVVRPRDQAQTRRHLVEEKSVADPPARRGVKDDVPRSPPLQSIELDHIVEGRHVADVARPDLIEHAIGQPRHPERLRLRKVALIGAGKQRSRVAHAAEPLVEANGAEKIFFGRARSGTQDTLHPVPRLLRPVVAQQHEISDGEPERLASFPRGHSTGKIDNSHVSKRGKCRARAAQQSKDARAGHSVRSGGASLRRMGGRRATQTFSYERLILSFRKRRRYA